MGLVVWWSSLMLRSRKLTPSLPESMLPFKHVLVSETRCIEIVNSSYVLQKRL
jgi:hypothetical protein